MLDRLINYLRFLCPDDLLPTDQPSLMKRYSEQSLVEIFLKKCPEDLLETHSSLLKDRLIAEAKVSQTICIDTESRSSSLAFEGKGSLVGPFHFNLLGGVLKVQKCSVALKGLNISDLSDFCAHVDLNRIENLDLSNNSIVRLDPLCKALKESDSLGSLTLDNNPISDEEALKLQNWLVRGRAVALSLIKTRITDAAANKLAKAALDAGKSSSITWRQ